MPSMISTPVQSKHVLMAPATAPSWKNLIRAPAALISSMIFRFLSLLIIVTVTSDILLPLLLPLLPDWLSPEHPCRPDPCIPVRLQFYSCTYQEHAVSCLYRLPQVL